MILETRPVAFHDTIIEDDEFEPLTQSEARELLSKMPEVGLWRVLGIQLIAGLVVIASSGFFGATAVISAVAGVMSAWVPAFVFVGVAQRYKKKQDGLSLPRIYLLELGKIVLTIGLLSVSVVSLKPLIWQAFLLSFVVVVKVYGIACWLALVKK